MSFSYDSSSTEDPQTYLTENGKGYAGRDYDVTLMNGETYKQVLLTYPYYDYFKVFGEYEKVKINQPAPQAYLELIAGYKDIFVEPTDGAVFRIYINEKLMIEQPYKIGDESINIGKTIRLSEATYRFRLEVEADISPCDYAAWAVVKLWDKQPK